MLLLDTNILIDVLRGKSVAPAGTNPTLPLWNPRGRWEHLRSSG